MHTAQPTSFHRALLAYYFRRRARKRLARIDVRGLERLQPWGAGRGGTIPLLLVANHSSWWDAVLPLLISLDVLRHDAYGMMEHRQLDRFRFFRRAGMFSVDRANPRAAMQALQYAAGVLQGTGGVLWLFPQGEITPNDKRPIMCYPGTAHLVRMLGRCAIAPVAFRYELCREELPVAYASIGATDVVEWRDEMTIPDMTATIQKMLTKEVDALQQAVISEELGDFTTILQGKGSIDARWDRARGITTAR